MREWQRKRGQRERRPGHHEAVLLVKSPFSMQCKETSFPFSQKSRRVHARSALAGGRRRT